MNRFCGSAKVTPAVQAVVACFGVNVNGVGILAWPAAVPFPRPCVIQHRASHVSPGPISAIHALLKFSSSDVVGRNPINRSAFR